jgi:hypothetical protein
MLLIWASRSAMDGLEAGWRWVQMLMQRMMTKLTPVLTVFRLASMLLLPELATLRQGSLPCRMRT